MVVSVWSTSYKKLTLFAFYNTPDRHTWVKSKHIAAKPYKMCPWIENNDNRPWAGQRQRSDLLMILLSNALSWSPCPFFQIAEQVWQFSWSMPVFQEFWKSEKLCSIGASREWPEITSKAIRRQFPFKQTWDWWEGGICEICLQMTRKIQILTWTCWYCLENIPFLVMEHTCYETSILGPHSG